MKKQDRPQPERMPDGTLYLGIVQNYEDDFIPNEPGGCVGHSVKRATTQDKVFAKPAPEKNAFTCGGAHRRARECGALGHADWHLPDEDEAGLLSAAFKRGVLGVSEKSARRDYWTSQTAWPYRPLAATFNLCSAALSWRILDTETFKSGHTVAGGRGSARLGVWLVRREQA